MQEFKTANAYVAYKNKQHYIEVVVNGLVQKDEFRQLLEKALEIACAQQCYHWLLDQRKIVSLAQHNYKWIVESWYPRLVKALPGQRFVASVFPKDLFGQLLSKQLLCDLGKDPLFQSKDFQNMEEAQKWLCKKQAAVMA